MRVAREAAASETVIWAAISAGLETPLYNRRLFEHPAEQWPQAKDEQVHELRAGANDNSTCVVAFFSKGRVATDGSCDQHPIKALRRVRWACAEVVSEGANVAAAFRSVLAALPQTSQALP